MANLAVSKIPVSPLSLEDATKPPAILFTPDNPYEATVVSVKRIVGPKAPGETCHIVLNHDGNVPSWEGQNYGVIDPALPPTHNMDYFSIASSRYGDNFDGKTSSLCVRRRDHGGDVANYLCDRKPGDKVPITGPYGDPYGLDLFLPRPLDPNARLIMVATGTGVAPFRAHLRRLFMEQIPNVHFNGLAWLFHGVANRDSLLYRDEFNRYRHEYPDNFLYDWALSREDVNPLWGKRYIQDKIAENADKILVLLNGGAVIYFSGYKGMMPGIERALKNAAEKVGMDWDEKLRQYKRNGQWLEQLY